MPKYEKRPATEPDPAEVEKRLERDRAAQANYDAQAERNAAALAEDPAQRELYRREQEGGGTILVEEKAETGAPENKAMKPSGQNKKKRPTPKRGGK